MTRKQVNPMDGFDAAVTPASIGIPRMVPVTTEAVAADPAAEAERQKQMELAQLTQFPGWSHFVESYKKQIDNLFKCADEDFEGKNYEEVGQITLANRMAANLMQRELTKVDAAAHRVFKKNKIIEE